MGQSVRKKAAARPLGSQHSTSNLSPVELLLALGRHHEPQVATLRTLKKVFNATPTEQAAIETALVQKGILLHSRVELSETGRSILRKLLPDLLLEGTAPLTCYRAYVASTTLGVPLDRENLSILADIGAVTAATSIRRFGEQVDLSIGKRRLVALAVRLVARDALNNAQIRLSVKDTWFATSLDPFLVDLFQAVTGSRESDNGLQNIVYGSFTKNADARWHQYSRMSFDSMIATARAPKKAARKELPSRVAAALSTILSSRWMPISQAFEEYRELERISLQEFKDAIAIVATDEQIELAPIDVPHLYPADTRSKSATTLGGLTFHLVRLRA